LGEEVVKIIQKAQAAEKSFDVGIIPGGWSNTAFPRNPCLVRRQFGRGLFILGREIVPAWPEKLWINIIHQIFECGRRFFLLTLFAKKTLEAIS
jgi:hypothetical protein